MTKNQHILFIHIPKTAGTSFRVAAEEYFGKENTFYDYAPKSKETSKEVIDYIYDAKDPYRFYEHISKLDHSFLSGHFPVTKYTSLYDTLNVVSFVRDPVEQVLSHYNHYKNIHNYDKDFRSFIKEPRFRNVQSKTLRGKPVEYYGFIGLTEEYELSIEMFNDLYGTKLSAIHINKKRKKSLKIKEINEDTLELIKRLNQRDLELYEKVKNQFHIRKKLYKKKLPFTHGFIQKVTEKQISGIAFQNNNPKALEIDIFVGEKYLETVLAKNLRPGQKYVPRKSYIGFDYIYRGNEFLEEKLYAYVANTKQQLI